VSDQNCHFNHHNFHCSSADSMLKKKLKRANDGLNATQKVYEEHCLYVGREKQREYLRMEEEAQTKRGESLRVYELSSTDG
jgi:hypothetical protein